MDKIYDKLFRQFDFENIRNQIFDKLNSDIDTFIFEKKYERVYDFFTKFKKYIDFKPDITYFEFKFIIEGNDICFFHRSDKNIIFYITNLKKLKISKNSDGSDAYDEWIFNEDYLKYLIYKIYKMKNPKFAHSLKSINDESSIISLKEENIKDYLNKDWNIIYESEESINYDIILEEKKKSFMERTKDNFFIRLILEKDLKELPKDFLKLKDYCSSFRDIFPLSKSIKRKNIIFHNEDIYYRYNLFHYLEMYYNYGTYGNFYINFKLLINSNKRHEKLERIAYFLSYLFPKDYANFEKFFEDNIKNKISEDLYSWREIIFEIINYFQNNIFKNKKVAEKKENSEQKDNQNANNEKIGLFDDNENKKFIIIFDDISTNEENKVVQNIMEECYNENFIFFTIYPLINEFTYKKFIEYINNPIDCVSPFSLIFTNLINFEQKSPNYNEIKEPKILEDFKANDESIIYDLIRIFNFKYIFFDSINRDKNLESLGFITKYIKYLNIQFDNKDKKIINIAFKNKNIEDKFRERYENILTQIKAKNNISFNNILGQKDGFDLEKIIISEIIYNSKQNFEILEVKSIFGLRELMKKNNFNYTNTNIFIKQNIPNTEMFDFAFKIIKENKQYLKIVQATSIKTEDEKEKLSIEKIKINCSYLKNEFKKNDLGNIDGFSFCIIAPLSIIKDSNKNYKDLKRFCRENNYEFILFDLNTCLFYERVKGNSIEKDIFEIDDKYLLNVIDFNEIIEINHPLTILSSRKVKERDEDKEDEKAEEKAKNLMGQSIKRIAKFEFKGNFTDLKKLNENYFAYIYLKSKEEISIYFYKEIIIKNNEVKDYNNFSDKRLTLILYSIKQINKEYFDSSLEFEIDKEHEEETIFENNVIKKKRKSKVKHIKNFKKSIKIKEEEIEIDEEKKNSEDKENDEEKQKISYKEKSIYKKEKENKSNKNKRKIKEKTSEIVEGKLDKKNDSKRKNKNEGKKFIGKKKSLKNDC